MNRSAPNRQSSSLDIIPETDRSIVRKCWQSRIPDHQQLEFELALSGSDNRPRRGELAAGFEILPSRHGHNSTIGTVCLIKLCSRRWLSDPYLSAALPKNRSFFGAVRSGFGALTGRKVNPRTGSNHAYQTPSPAESRHTKVPAPPARLLKPPALAPSR